MRKIKLSPEPSGRSEAELEIHKTELLDEGTRVKYRVSGAMRSPNNPDRTVPISLVKRQNEFLSETFTDKWKMLKKLGFPVANTLRLDPNGEYIYMTDLTADGSEIFGKNKYQKLSDGVELARIPKKFLEASSEAGMENIRSQVNECLRLANENHILLSYDDCFELVVHPDGSAKVMTLDLKGIRKDNYGHDHIVIEAFNRMAADKFFACLSRIRQYLLAHNP